LVNRWLPDRFHRGRRGQSGGQGAGTHVNQRLALPRPAEPRATVESCGTLGWIMTRRGYARSDWRTSRRRACCTGFPDLVRPRSTARRMRPHRIGAHLRTGPHSGAAGGADPRRLASYPVVLASREGHLSIPGRRVADEDWNGRRAAHGPVSTRRLGGRLHPLVDTFARRRMRFSGGTGRDVICGARRDRAR